MFFLQNSNAMKFFLFFLFLGLVSFSFNAHAQGHSAYCNMADSTAAVQSCLKTHLGAAQKRLNQIYDSLYQKLGTEKKRNELKELQQSWLKYRDSECKWESESTETPALKRINELSCMARVSEDRADLLGVISTDEEFARTPREYGSFPRWMNVLAKDYPSIYWNYGKRSAIDLNCDEEAEQIMVGMSAKPSQLQDQSEPLYNQEIILSIVENPSTGRPKAKLFKFPLVKEDLEGSICMDFTNYSVKKAVLEEDESGKCPLFLEVTHGTCRPKIIQWDGKNFILQKQPNLEIKEEIKE